MANTSERVVLITGASAGIGEALAREFVARGWRAVLVARRVERIAALARELGEGRCLAVPGDVTVDGDMEAAVARAKERYGRLDAVVANAGFGVNGAVTALRVDDYRRQFDTNVLGVVRTANAAIPSLTDTRGVFAAVGSVSGYLATPGTVPYAMSKFAVRAWCDGARAELAPRGIAVLHVAPGFVESEIRKVDRNGRLHEDHRDPVPAWLVMPARTAARQIVEAVEKRRPELVVTGHGKVGVFLARHAPGFVRAVMSLAGRRGPVVTKPDA